MRSGIYEYVRNIAVFLIVMGFSGIIVPEGKLKNYINLSLKLVLVLIVALPLVSLISGGPGASVSEIGLRFQALTIQDEYAYNNETQNALILESYKNDLEAQVKSLLQPFSDYRVEECLITVDESEDNFGALIGISVIVAKNGGGADAGSIIYIEPIRVSGPYLPGTDPDNEDDDIKNMEKAISDFYNVTSNNIYVNVQRME